jgi:hypothetical protein
MGTLTITLTMWKHENARCWNDRFNFVIFRKQSTPCSLCKQIKIVFLIKRAYFLSKKYVTNICIILYQSTDKTKSWSANYLLYWNKSMGIKHVAELGTPRLYFYSLTLRVFRRSSKYRFYRLWFDPVEELRIAHLALINSHSITTDWLKKNDIQMYLRTS